MCDLFVWTHPSPPTGYRSDPFACGIDPFGVCVWPQVMNLTGLAIFGHHHHGVACEHAHGHSHGHSEAEEKGHGAAGVRARGYSQVCTPTEEGYLQTGRTEGT